MIPKVSKADFHIQVLLAVAIVLLLCVPSVLRPEPPVFPEDMLWNNCFGWLASVPFLGVIFESIATILSALILNKVLTNNHLQSSNSFYPQIVFFIFAFHFQIVQWSPEIVCGLLLLLALQPLYNINDEKSGENAIFLSSFLLGIAAWISPALLITILLPVSAIAIFGTPTLRKILLSISGFLLVWIWAIAIAFLTNQLGAYGTELLSQITPRMTQFKQPTNGLSWSSILLEVALMLPVVWVVFRLAPGDVVINRRRIYTTIALFILLIISLFATNNPEQHHYLLFIPETIFVGYLYERLPKVKMVGFTIFLILLLNLMGRWNVFFT